MSASQQFDDHLLPLLEEKSLTTPAFVYDEAAVTNKLELLAKVRERCGCQILYSVKALSFSSLLNTIADHVDGFSASSLFECRLAREVLGEKGSIHVTSPGLSLGDLQDIANISDYLSFNSSSQWQRCKSHVERLNCGLRVNPELSFVKDDRFDPCRDYSKLGIPLSQLATLWRQQPETFAGISGIHIHTNSESENFRELEQTINKVKNALEDFMPGLDWINLGGGYLFDNTQQLDVLCSIASGLKQQNGMDVFFEPGNAIVNQAGYLVATVIDLFDSGGKIIAVLDTTVNHLPEVFEYQYKPVVLQECADGAYSYRLAGASCLSGDLFGDYCFADKLQVGSRIIFANTGAYMLVKASIFNGINLPAIYSLNSSNELRLQKEYDYGHYRSRW